MPDELSRSMELILLYFPLGLIGIWRWSLWIFRKFTGIYYRPTKENGFKSMLSIVTPVYNEEPDIFKRALRSWKSNRPDEIIAVIDYSDKVNIEIFKKLQKSDESLKLIVTKRPGKREALADGIRIAHGEIIALVDSDTIWGQNIKNKLIAPFIDPEVGGVATRQKVLNGNTISRRLFNIFLDQRYALDMTYLAVLGNALTCISGRTAVYRASAIKHLTYELENETFLGKKCISGDDKCLTRLVQQTAWKVRFQYNAIVYTIGAPDLKTFFKQQVRWIRNSFRSDSKSLGSRWIWKKEKILAYHMIDRFIQPFTLILGPIYLGFAIYLGHWTMVQVLLIWWLASRGIKIFSHLREHPADFFMLPVYLISTYFLAVLKIFALITIARQGWITRWSNNRLELSFAYLKNFLAVSSTLLLLFLITFSLAKVQNVNDIKEEVSAEDKVQSLSHNKEAEMISNYKKIAERFNEDKFGTYAVRRKDTLSSISRKYNIDLSVLVKNNPGIINVNRISEGDIIKVPINELRNTLKKEELSSRRMPEVLYSPIDNSITVKGEGSVVDLATIKKQLGNNDALERIGGKEWILRSNLFIKTDVTLILDGEEVSWLKLKSDEEIKYIRIRAYGGNILINNTKITSWDEKKQAPDTNYKDGRSYVLMKKNGRMDILNSELAYLGFPGDGKRGAPDGGVYGVSYKIISDSLESGLITGNVIGNKLHHNYFGFYTYGATGMIVKDNEVHDNDEYGIDPHDDSNNLLIEGNTVYNNGNHGIITSKRCFENIIRNNISYDNRLHGIMLDRHSNYNLVEDNVTFGNVDGIAIYDSHFNLIRNNKISENERGVRLNVYASRNILMRNYLADNNKAIYMYKEANNNYALENEIENNSIGFQLKNASYNVVQSMEEEKNKTGLKVKNAANNFIR